MNLQFARTPINTLAFVEYFAQQSRQVRSKNQVDGTMTVKKENELHEISQRPEFRESPMMSTNTFNEMYRNVYATAETVYKYYNSHVFDPQNPNQEDSDYVAQIRELECIHGANLWITLVVSKSRQNHPNLDQLADQITLSLLELGRDQLRPSRRIIGGERNGELDPEDALPAELEQVKKEKAALDAAARHMKESKELRVNKTAGNLKRKDVNVNDQEDTYAQKKQEKDNLRAQAELAYVGNTVDVEHKIGDYFALSAQLKASQLEEKKAKEDGDVCPKLWRILHEPSSYTDPESLPLITTFLAREAYDEADDLRLMRNHEDHSNYVRGFMKTIAGDKLGLFMKK
jgi:hypothetical protein